MQTKIFQKIKLSRKGIAPILVVAIVGVLLEAVVLTNFVQRTEHLIRTVREAEIMQAVNNIELAKKSLQQALIYSTYQGYYNAANSGGYADLKSVDTYDCIPYLRVYGTTNFPADYEKNTRDSILKVLNSYAKSINYPYLTMPEYTNVKIGKNNITATSAADLDHKTDLFEIKNNPSVSADFDFEIKKMFEFTKQNFIDSDRLGDAARQGSDHKDAMIKIVNLESTMQNEIKSFGNYEISLTAFKVSSSDSSFALRVLVKIIDKNSGSDKGYPIYDLSENTTKERNIEMKFYVLTGKGEQRNPDVNECKQLTKS